MDKDTWVERIKHVVNTNDVESLDIIAKLLEESEKAKQILREKGYGWTGLSLLNTVSTQVPSND